MKTKKIEKKVIHLTALLETIKTGYTVAGKVVPEMGLYQEDLSNKRDALMNKLLRKNQKRQPKELSVD